MKKTLAAKLAINKETVSNLNTRQMNEIRGGYATASCPAWGCDTNEAVCTTGCMDTRYCASGTC